MLISKNQDFRVRSNNDVKKDFINLYKHYPLFKIFDFNNRDYLGCDIIHHKEHLLPFLKKERTCYINSSLVYLSTRNIKRYLPEYLKNYHNLNSFEWYNEKISYSFCTLAFRKEFSFLLCIKPEYIYYVKLCYLANQELEFDCFYVLAKTNVSQIQNVTYRKLYSIVQKHIKDYGIETRYVNSIEEEIAINVDLPKFNTIKDYNNWLLEIKNDWKESTKKQSIKKSVPF